ncbi:MAG: immunoglobulin domain-containing protein [Vicinamibacterales bacterium]
MHDTPVRRRLVYALTFGLLALDVTVFTAPPGSGTVPQPQSTSICLQTQLGAPPTAHSSTAQPVRIGRVTLSPQTAQQSGSPAPITVGTAGTRILAWNNLGMHCMDSSYAEFSILPPYNTVEAQLIVGGRLVKSGSGYTLTYEAVPDPSGSINTTSVNKGNWFAFAPGLYGKPIGSADQGLSSWNMPGPLNLPQAMLFEAVNVPAPNVSTPVNWFRAEGIPITPWDDAGNKNYYPLMRIVARNASNAVIAQSDVVLPVSDEMDCRSCHGANTQAAARPAGGWVVDANKDREFRLNVLKLHDDRERVLHPALYAEALAAKGIAFGLYDSAMSGKPVLCASCHASEALGAPSFTSTQGNGAVPALTRSVHGTHATARDPKSGLALDSAANRSACYSCHPGSTTLCLRGAMGAAVAADGSMAMQCQSCHGGMSQVAAPTRTGWFNEPTCQSCHTGTATNNNGQIRYTSVFDSPGHERVPVNTTFATSANTPAAGLSLYRFSTGHGGLQCSACHGSTHAEFPSSHDNDNLRNVQLQGHEGVMVECNSCHTSTPVTDNRGPHGMHPIGQQWVQDHHDAVSRVGLSSCRACHGANDRGTELSRAQADRSFSVEGTTQRFYRGATIGCYTCHRGPSSDGTNTTAPPMTGDVSARTQMGVPVSLTLPGGTTAGVTMRILRQPRNGTVGLQNGVATYFPFADFVGTDTFTFAGYDGSKNSVTPAGIMPALGTVTVGTTTLAITTQPQNQAAVINGSATFSVTAAGQAPLQYQWFHGSAAIAGAATSTLILSPVTLADAGNYSVVVSNVGGSVTSTTATLTVKTPQPVTTGLTPASGPVGTTVAITGSSLTWTSNVTFNGTGGTFTVQSDSRVNAVVPAGATSGPVVVTSPGGSVSAGVFTVTAAVAVPTVTDFAPVSGGPGTAVTITGTNFTGATRVLFGSTAAPFTVISATQIVAGVPRNATSGRLSVTTAAGTARSTGSFTVGTRAVAPTVTGLSPTSGKVETVVTLTGTNLGAAIAVKLGSLPASFRVTSARSLQVTVPAGAVTALFQVTTTGGVESSGTFTVVR